MVDEAEVGVEQEAPQQADDGHAEHVRREVQGAEERPPGNERLSSSAIPSGSTTSSGTDATVKIAVARTLSHQSPNTSESEENSSL
ncbi:hypothetical protein Phou_076510 [Phytohabitans houttuyneae]|uniref:Uncharacterized protein n=1 Tax=Phytohabitans houttuyneae TaxID=1076126 RepID=A0A6V8KM17_9ACTN|nr:hypothetical protein Phou_076510 [Phytohabitans houttuyneae]